MADAKQALSGESLINELEYAVLARSQGLPGSAEKLSEAKQAIRAALGVSPSQTQSNAADDRHEDDTDNWW